MSRLASCAWLSVLMSIPLALGACSSPENPPDGAVAVVKQAVAPVTSCELPNDSVSRLVLPAGVDVVAAGAVAYGTLKVNDRARIVASSGAGLPVYNVGGVSAGAWISEVGVSGRVGPIQSVPSVFLRNNAIVQGGIQTEGIITVQGGEQVSGSRVQGAHLPDARELSWLPDFVDGPGTNVVVQNQTSATRAPGTYGDVQVHSGSTLTLSPGVYRMRTLQLEPQSTLGLSDSSGPIIIHVSTGIIWRGNVVASSAAQNFLVVYGGSSFSALEKPFKGTLIAPQASVRLGTGGTPHTGAFFAEQLEIDPDVQVTHVPFAHWDEVLHRQELTRHTGGERMCDGDACCPAGMDHAFLDDANNVLGIDFENLCVLARGGNDKLTPIDLSAQGRVAVLAGSGDDLVQGGESDDLLSGSDGDDTLLAGGGADELFGGMGDDYLCAGDGDDLIIGGPGNDTILAGDGADTVTPGPGVDTAHLGAGDDVLYVYDPCELEPGELFDGGAGHDTLVTPLSLAELQALGVTVRSFEEVRVETDRCRSECVERPNCNGNGMCVDRAGALSCVCKNGFGGDDCTEEGPLTCVDGPSGISTSLIATLAPDNHRGVRYESAPLAAGHGLLLGDSPGSASSTTCDGSTCTVTQGLEAPSNSAPFRIVVQRAWEQDSDGTILGPNGEDETKLIVGIDGQAGVEKGVEDSTTHLVFERLVDSSKLTIAVSMTLYEHDSGLNAGDEPKFDIDFTVDNFTGLPTGGGLSQDAHGRWCRSGGGSGICFVIEPAGRPGYCASWNAHYLDAGLGEDYASTAGLQRIPAAHALGRVVLSQGGVPVAEWKGTFDENGCIPPAERPNAAAYAKQTTTGLPLTVTTELSTQFCLDQTGQRCAGRAGLGVLVDRCVSGECVRRNGRFIGVRRNGPATLCTVVTEDPALTAAHFPDCEVVHAGDPWVNAALVMHQDIGGRRFVVGFPAHDTDTRSAALVSSVLAQQTRTADMGLNRLESGPGGVDINGDGVINTDDFEADIQVVTNVGCELADPLLAETILDSCASEEELFINENRYPCPGTGCVVDDLSESFFKNVIAHEFGHVVQHFNGGNPTPSDGYAEASTAGPRLARCDHVAGANGWHCLQSWEPSPAAQGEGFAHFFASKVWNDPAEADCSFGYYKEVLNNFCMPGSAGCSAFTLDPSLTVNAAPVPVGCKNSLRWRNNKAQAFTIDAKANGLDINNDGVLDPVGYIATEWDWMTFFSTLNSDPVAPWSITNFAGLYELACGGHCWGRTSFAFDYTVLHDEVVKFFVDALGRPNPLDPMRQSFEAHGDSNGVGENVNP